MGKWRLNFQFFFLNLSSKVLAGVGVRTSRYPYMDICVTLGARVFLNSRVDLIVFIQVTGLGEGLVTKGADNGLVSSV